MAPIHWLNKNGRTKCDQHIQTSATKRMQSSATKRIECSATSANNTVRQSAYNTVKPAQTIQLKTDNSHLNKKNMAILLAVLRRSTISVVVWMKRKIFLIKVARMEHNGWQVDNKIAPLPVDIDVEVSGRRLKKPKGATCLPLVHGFGLG